MQQIADWLERLGMSEIKSFLRWRAASKRFLLSIARRCFD